MLESVTLDQLRMFIAVADEGSFTAAAKRVSRAQSAVSQAMATLESQLGLTLFDRRTRKPGFTPAGRAVLADARDVIARIERLKARARGIGAGLESHIALAVSVVVPSAVLAETLSDFEHAFPETTLQLFIEEIGGATQMLEAELVDLGFAGKPSLELELFAKLEALPIGSIDIVSVAAPDHPLAALDRPLTDIDLEDHRQLTPTSRASPVYPNQLVETIWAISDLGFRHELLRRGVGWGTMPRERVADDLAAGRLVELAVASRPLGTVRVPLFAIHRPDNEPGPARRWLVERVERGLAEHLDR